MTRKCVFGLAVNSGTEGPDQTMLMRRLIWTFAVALCPKTCLSAVLLDIASGLKFILCHIFCVYNIFCCICLPQCMPGSVCASSQGSAHACRVVRVSAD